MRLYSLIGNALAAFLDFSAGVFVICLVALALGYRADPAAYIIGGILGMAPDFDVFYMFFKKKRVYGDHHQFITHRPVFGIALSSLFGLLLGGDFWVIAAPSCLFWHYLHDTEGFGGGGVAWFWPLSKQYYSPFRIASPEKSLMGQNQDRHDNWLEATWLVPSKKSVTEIAIGSALLGIVAINIFDWKAGLLTVDAVWMCVFSLWMIFLCSKAHV